MTVNQLASLAWLICAAGRIPLAGSLAWLWHEHPVSEISKSMRGSWTVTLIVIYVQLGLLLMKRGSVRARTAAPAENAESYLMWRESLRQLSTTLCDYARLIFLWPLLLLWPLSFANQGNDSEAQILTIVLIVTPVVAWYEWRRRQQHLRVAQEMEATEFLVKPDSDTAGGFVCFNRSLPVLLLRGPNGYVLNLASAPARTAGFYLAGCAVLLASLAR